jgi:hypothetical protein
MRRLIVQLAAGLLVLTVAAPGTGAPELGKNKHVSDWEIDCTGSNMPGLGVFTVTAKGVPGWATEPGSQPPLLFRSGTFNVYEGGVLVEGPFTMHLAGGTIRTFDIVASESWYVIPAGR